MTRYKLQFVLLAVVLVALGLQFKRHRQHQNATLNRQLRPATLPGTARLSSRPRIYPYSVIPGGAFNKGELRDANNNDQVVRVHYASFNLDNVHLVTAEREQLAYVSFRKADQIYWTSRKVLIPRGEQLLTDGTNVARARCGNRLADTLPAAALTDKPPEELLDAAIEMPRPAAIDPSSPALFSYLGTPALGAPPAFSTENAVPVDGTPIADQFASAGPSGMNPPLGMFGGPGFAPPGINAPGSSTPNNPGTSGPNDPGTPGDPGNPLTPVPPVVPPTSTPEPRFLGAVGLFAIFVCKWIVDARKLKPALLRIPSEPSTHR